MGGGDSKGNATQPAFQQAPVAPPFPTQPVQIQQSVDWYQQYQQQDLLKRYLDRIRGDQEQGALPLPGTSQNDSGSFQF